MEKRDDGCQCTISVTEYANLIGFTRAAVASAIRAGRIPAIRLHPRGKYRIPIRAVRANLEATGIDPCTLKAKP